MDGKEHQGDGYDNRYGGQGVQDWLGVLIQNTRIGKDQAEDIGGDNGIEFTEYWIQMSEVMNQGGEAEQGEGQQNFHRKYNSRIGKTN